MQGQSGMDAVCRGCPGAVGHGQFAPALAIHTVGSACQIGPASHRQGVPCMWPAGPVQDP